MLVKKHNAHTSNWKGQVKFYVWPKDMKFICKNLFYNIYCTSFGKLHEVKKQ